MIRKLISDGKCEESTITFRGYDWGTSKEEIMKNEITSDMVADVDYLEEDDGLLINGQSRM